MQRVQALGNGSLKANFLHIDVNRRGPGDRFPASALDAVMMMMLIDCIVEAGGIAEANTCSALLGRCL